MRMANTRKASIVGLKVAVLVTDNVDEIQKFLRSQKVLAQMFANDVEMDLHKMAVMCAIEQKRKCD